ncbi:MAG TPA: glycosyltransferase family A protein [Noviherbaspirillum sp.]|uniref:glycosyltransferase family A protein n=1 Tax=Noviherbaspirillum sp. TaxID=1926288 RepID=UPI002B48E45F|nr:glycosyltransferase family A protein [Noviherbaspirillum sp.]HJV87372.1 glycosyltransferase family A protein [Noviherbaspirillum sp.]
MAETHTPSVSVLVPTFEQAHFIARGLDSLQAQSLIDWEAIIIDDGSEDGTAEAVSAFMDDARIRYHRLSGNTGLGHALNEALSRARAPLIAYLPSDDVYYRNHLDHLKACLDANHDAALAYSGVRHHYNRHAAGQVPGFPLQLVQCMHRKCDARWVERAELESNDLERLYWSLLRPLGAFVGSGTISCEWVSHPAQRHRLMREPEGGISTFRSHYRISEPLRFHSTVGHLIDEVAHYRPMRERPDTPQARDGLRILLVGELAYNADRILALEEQGHTLYGLWMQRPYWYNTVGPLPFGHVEDLPRDNWQEAVRRVQPDVIYALLNWQAVPFAHEVMLATRGIPFIWHFKEGPFICMEKGTWPQLIDLHRMADGQIFSSPEMRDWFDTVVPGLSGRKPTHVLDGDLPKRDWFAEQRTPLLSETDGELHTVSPGRPIGLHPQHVAALARHGIHLHFYGEITHGMWLEWIEKTQALAPHHVHLHRNVGHAEWTSELSRYDAGWLHVFQSANGGEIRRANWDDLNYPARMSALAAAGLPMLQQANVGAIVATQEFTRRHGIGVFFDTVEELAERLKDRQQMQAVRERVWQQRHLFTFDHHVPALVDFFRAVIASAAGRVTR